MLPKLICLLVTFLACTLSLHAEEEKSDEKKKEKKSKVTQYGKITIDGKKIDYTVTAAKLQLKKDDDTPQASIFHVSYLRKGGEDVTKRPVVFAFNGGPGSSAVWLHLGALGPKLVPTSEDGTIAIQPPVILEDNPYSILDVADLVFIDPVSTGYSRKEEKAKKSDFHGVSADVNSVADFIRRWVTEHDRWASPKYLLGESYGGIRAAGLSNRLQSRYGMSLNGVVLLSSLLDYRTLRGGQGDFIDSLTFLPAMTAVAHHHGKIKGDRDALVQEARDFTDGAYASALLQGSNISEKDKATVAKRLSELTGVSADLWSSSHLKLGSTRFRRELLRSEGKVLGRFDGRVSWPAANNDSQHPGYDPSYAVAFGAFSTAMLDYLSRDIGWEEDRPYEILTGNVHPWNFGGSNSYTNMSSSLSSALRDNPHLRVLVMCGKTDLATPPDGILYSLRQSQLPASSSERIFTTWYDAGHMFYLNKPDIEKMRKDLVEFIKK